MQIIECGSASGSLRVGNDGVGVAIFRGLLVPANFLALSALTMRAGLEHKATGLLYHNEKAAVCCDPVSMTSAYPTLAPVLRALPVAFVINAGQAEMYQHVVQRAAEAGLLRRAFFNEAEARDWLASTIGVLDANRDWWQSRVPGAGGPHQVRSATRSTLGRPGAQA